MRLLLRTLIKFFLFFPIILLVLFLKAVNVHGASETREIPLKFQQIAEITKIGVPIRLNQLPSPYNEILTQPLMTQSIETYYGRSAIIKALFAEQDPVKNVYSRSIMMFIDKSKQRNNPDEALEKNEAMVVELAFISINFNELPKNVKQEILNTNIPFGKLLNKYQIQIATRDRKYYKIKCNSDLVSLIHCKEKQFIYGRTNTIIRSDNKKWLAHVVEILP